MTRLLSAAGFEVYLPLVELERRWADRRKRVGFPLFPGYVFARFELARMHPVLATPGVVTIVRAGGRPTPVREEELEAVRILVEGANRTGRVPTASEFLEVGQEVVVTAGPFEGMRGVLLEAEGGTHVVVRLTAIRQAASVELPREQVRRA